MTFRHLTVTVTSSILALGWFNIVNAYTFKIDSFKIIRNNSLFFEDTFSDGSPPPSAPNFPNGTTVSYLVTGTVGPESGGKLTIDSLSATTVGSITGVGAFIFQQARLLTSTDSSNLATGLKIDDTFAVTGVFDLVLPSATIEGYGISLTDRTSAEGNDDLRLEVRKNDAGSHRVTFIRADATANTFTILATALVDASHQQIALTLSRQTTTNNQIVASFAYVDGGVQGPTTTFPASSTIFHNENFTRATFFAETPLFPTSLGATPGAQLVDLRWNSFSSGVRGWNVYFRQKSTVSWNRIPNIGNPTDPRVPTTNQLFYRVDRNPLTGQTFLTNGISYEFSVTAVTNSGDESLKSSVVTAMPNGGNAQNNEPLPVLFLHGIASNASAWDETIEFIKRTFRWTDGGIIKIIPYGLLCTGSNPLRLSTFAQPCVEFLGFGVKANFYTANFADKNANYNNGVDGIQQQGREVKAFIEKLRTLFPAGQQFIVVGHSMGGLAARSYMAGLNTTYGGEIARLITYGTPHLGVPTVALLGSSVISAGLALKMPELDQNSDGIRDLDLLSSFLTQLNAKPLAPADYRSIVSYGPLSTNCYPLIPFSQSFVFDVLGVSDCVVSAFSQDLANVPIVNPQIRSRITRSTGFQHHVDGETRDYGKISCALGLGCLIITTRSPVDVEITDPAGFQLSKSLNEIPGAVYEEGDIDGDGELNDVITIPLSLAGNYQIRVIPDSEANASETYSLETNINGVTTILAQNQRLQDIPIQPFLVGVPLSLNIDIKPGGIPNSIQRRSQGRIPVAILSTQTFDATTRVNRLSLTFGHTGDETSLDFCNQGEDVNGDGLLDLVCHFRTQSTNFQVGDVEGVLKGETVDGLSLRGTESVRILQ